MRARWRVLAPSDARVIPLEPLITRHNLYVIIHGTVYRNNKRKKKENNILTRDKITVGLPVVRRLNNTPRNA